MNWKGFLVGTVIVGAVTAGVVVILNRRHEAWDRQMRESSKSFQHSPHAETIAQSLREHSGEESTMIHAFEDALETETRWERQLARETGLEA